MDSGRYASLVGRILLALIFLGSGFSKVTAWSATAGYMVAKGMPMVPVLLAGAALLELAGGLAVLVGYHARIAAWALFLYLIPTTLIFHNFWVLEGMERQNMMGHFMKNLAIMGGLLILAAHGPGAASLDAGRTKAD